ncbi:SDR family oxidoreductase [Euryhalocaulis caribicus]|uniref:SDR family oxidoreductase n=1 Tax=Euryhalocaulis caribicus TaxID=1161401 RepID=UPI0003B5F04E|nr:SDR family oxidoreductase [Euryhalocaulis caribicus]
MILITGATGTNGSLIAERFAAAGIPARHMVRDSDGVALPTYPGSELVEADFDDPASLAGALKGVTAAFLVTPSSAEAEARQQRFVDAAEKAGLPHLVKLSQFAADEGSPVRFLRYHAAVEARIRERLPSWTLLRPNLYMQGLLGFAGMIAEGTLPGAAGSARVSLIDVRDIADVAVAALTEPAKHHGQTYTLTGPAAPTHDEIASELSRVVGTQVKYTDMPPEALAEAAKAMGMDLWQADGLAEDYAHYVRGEAAEVTGTVAAVTGHAARDLRAFLTDHGGAFRHAA